MMRNAAYAAALLAATLVMIPSVSGRPQGVKPSQGDALQPDKVLYDRAVSEIQRKRFVQSRLLLQTLLDTYDSSEFLAKARLALAESWFKQGGERGLAQAQVECKQVVMLYPDGPEAKAAQAMLEEMEAAGKGKPAPAR